MTATINIHNIRAVKAKEFQRVEWLEFECEDGTTVSVFMPLSAAQAMADAFNTPQPPELGTASPINGE